MSSLLALLEKNRRWAAETEKRDPEFFTRLARQQTPEHLWIGCADSRVAANTITGLDPGEVFVHRNIANVVVHTDLNMLSVLQYAVDVLKVKNIIVCGHYGCGGVVAALKGGRLGLIDNWLRHIQDVQTKYQSDLDELDGFEAQSDRLCELNVIEQLANVCRTSVVLDAWDRGQELTVHGLIYGLQDGLLRELKVRVSGPEQLDSGRAEGLAQIASR